jgi:hypothetical protein
VSKVRADGPSVANAMEDKQKLDMRRHYRRDELAPFDVTQGALSAVEESAVEESPVEGHGITKSIFIKSIRS